MSTRSEKLHFGKPVKDVRFSKAPSAQDLSRRLTQQEKSGYDRGWLEAQTQLNEQLSRERAQLAELQNGVLTALQRALPQMARDGEQALIALALEAVKKLVAGLPVTAELVEATVQEALRQAEDGAEATVLLHPEDLALLERMNSTLLSGTAGDQRVQFRSAPEVSRGGCIVQTRFGVIDGCRETKLELLRKCFLE